MMQLVQRLLLAAEILDNETPSTTTTSSSRWSGRAVSALKSRWNELRRQSEKELERSLAIETFAAIQNKSTESTTTAMEKYMQTTRSSKFGRPLTALAAAAAAATTNRDKQQSIKNNNTNSSRTASQAEQDKLATIVPLWVPSSILPFMIASRARVQKEDIVKIRDRVLEGTGFSCTRTESIPSAVLFKGNLRRTTTTASVTTTTTVGGGGASSSSSSSSDRNVSAAVFGEIQRRMDVEGLSNRVQLFFLLDPEWKPSRDESTSTTTQHHHHQPRPVLLAVSKLVNPDERMMPQSIAQTILKRSSVVLTVLATFSYAISCYALNPTFFDSIVNQRNPRAITQCIPIFLGLFFLQTIHEAAHILVARQHGIQIGPPLLTPSTQLGTFGCITNLRSFPNNRAALMDFALSGPLAGWATSVVFMLIGIVQTVRASSLALTNFPFVPVSLLKSSFIVGGLLSLFAPKTMLLPLSQPIPVSPLVLIGFSGMYAAALNLLPVFKLDGGRACHAAVGPRMSAIASAATLMFMLSIATSTNSGLAFAWGVFVILFQRHPEVPVRDDVTEVDDTRRITWAASVAASVLSLVPFPGGPGFL